jgi:hypothetical protein
MKRANRQARRNPNPDPFAELQQRSLSWIREFDASV